MLPGRPEHHLHLPPVTRSGDFLLPNLSPSPLPLPLLRPCLFSLDNLHRLLRSPCPSPVSTQRQSDLFNITNLSRLKTPQCHLITFRTKSQL